MIFQAEEATLCQAKPGLAPVPVMVSANDGTPGAAHHAGDSEGVKATGERSAGNLHAAFEEGGQG